MTLALLLWLQICCNIHGVEPEFALAVARLESGTKTETFRLGRLGKTNLYGPMGVRSFFLEKGDAKEVIEVGVKALRPRKGERTKRDILKRYVGYRDIAYEKGVLAMYSQYKRKGVFR